MCFGEGDKEEELNDTGYLSICQISQNEVVLTECVVDSQLLTYFSILPAKLIVFHVFDKNY